MGIRGLTSYVNTLPFGKGKVWESFNLRNTKLVIDGRGLCYQIYEHNKLNFKFGGQYDELQNKVKHFFSKLQQNNVVPYVVFDGIEDTEEKKSTTHKERNKKKIEQIKKLWTSREPSYKMVLPRLTNLAVMQVLQEMKVPYAVADFEADCEIASLAKRLDAPVLASDSDFYIFNIQHGYIPFENYDFSGPNTTVKKFSFDAFVRHLGINPSMLPLLASLAGNDYISDEMLTMLRPFHNRFRIRIADSSNKFRDISDFLSSYNSNSAKAIDDVINKLPNDDRASVTKALKLSIKEYQMGQSNLNLIDYFNFTGLSCNMLTYNGHSLPQWVVKLYRQGLIASEGLDCLCNRKIFLGIQSEDIELPSAHICAQGLRWRYYKLVLNCEGATNTDSTSQVTTENIVVTEIDREKSERVEKKVNLTREIPEMNVQIHDIRILGMSEEDRKRHILLGLLDSDLPSIHGLPPEHQLVAAAMRYWVIRTKIETCTAHLAALLVFYVGEKWSLTTEESFEISVEAVHGFAEWQNVLHWAEQLNMLFPRTFPPLQVARLYDGVRVCKLYEKLRASGITSAAKSIVTNMDDYNRLFDAIINPNE